MDIKNKDIYTYATIVISQYWSHYVEGNNTNEQLTDNAVRDMDALCDDLENVPLHVLFMKEEDYFMIPMCTYWTNERVCDEKLSPIVEMRTRLKFPENMQNHYHNRDTVE